MIDRVRPRAVLFDWNGTLNDMSTVREQDKLVGREEFGLELSDQDVIDCWGQPAEAFYPALFGRGGDTRPWREMRRIFRSYDHMFPRNMLPGVEATLDALDNEGIPTGIITASPRSMVMDFLEDVRLDPLRFKFIHTENEVCGEIAAGRPVLTRALGELALPAHSVVLVGDEDMNMHDANAVGAEFVIVSNGSMSRERLVERGVPEASIIPDLHPLPGRLGIGTRGN